MFKQLITSTLLATAIGIQNTTNYADSVNEFRNFSNIQEENEYTDEILDRQERYSILEYKQIWIGTNINIRARAIQRIDRNIADNEYILQQCLVLKLDSSLTMHQWTFEFQDQPQYESLIQDKTHIVYYYQSASQDVINFLNGQNYIGFDGVEAEFNRLRSDTTLLANPMSYDGSKNYYINNDYIGNYIMVYSSYDYDPTTIVDNGSFLIGMVPYTKIESTAVWEVPAGPQGEIVDIPGMMFTILGMPFAWISTAFNFTIFPGTAYAVNISNILMAIVLGLIVLYIVKKIIK